MQNRAMKLGEKIDAYRDWSEPFKGKVDSLISEADIIGGLRFVRLESVVEWKKARNKGKRREGFGDNRKVS